MFNPASANAVGDAHEIEPTFKPSDFSFLPQLLNILQKIDGGEEPQEIARLSSNLRASFKKCLEILDNLPGADLSPDEQERILREETLVLERKKAQLETYLSWPVFNHDMAEASIKQDIDNITHLPDSDIGGAGERQIDIEVKREHHGSLPSLVTDDSSLSDSSHVPSLNTGLTFTLADVKMEEVQNPPL